MNRKTGGRGVEYRQLKYILTVAECGSITAAAQQLYISQPALSNFISKTENSLGVKLFKRGNQALELTYAGEKYVRAAKRIVSTYEKMERQIEEISQERRGKLRIGMSELLFTYLAPVWNEVLHGDSIDIEAEVIEGNGEKLKQLLSGRAVDVCILPQAGQDPDYYSVELHRADVFIVAKSGCFDKVCPDHAARDIDVREIADMPILAPPVGDPFRDVIDGLFASAGVIPSNIIECFSRGSTLRMAAAGQGIDINSEIALETINPGGPIEIHGIRGGSASAGIFALFRKDAYIGRLEQHLIQALSKKFAALRAGRST